MQSEMIYELRTLVNDLLDEIDELNESAGVVIGKSTKVDQFRAHLLMAIVEKNPTGYAIGLFRTNLSKLNRIESIVGSQNESLCDLSDSLAKAVIGVLNLPICNAQMMTQTGDFKSSLKNLEVVEIRQQLIQIVSILSELNQLKTSSEYSKEVVQLQNKVVELERKFNPSAGGCYIATYVYGDYDSPEVLALRLFRDNFLSQYALGRYFIKEYYIISPKLIAKYSENKSFRRISKMLVSCLVKLVK